MIDAGVDLERQAAGRAVVGDLVELDLGGQIGRLNVGQSMAYKDTEAGVERQHPPERGDRFRGIDAGAPAPAPLDGG